MILALFFPLRPGEYCKDGMYTQSTPFRICDVTLFIGPRRFSALTTTRGEIVLATFVSPTFNN